MADLTANERQVEAFNWYAPTHFTTDSVRAVCGNAMAHSLAFDPEDPAISCDRCRLYLRGYRAGKAAR